MNSQPILIVPYMWIGDFVRCHTVVQLLRARHPYSPIDMLATSNTAPLLDYMPGIRKGVVVDLPRKRLAFHQHAALARRLRTEGYGRALIMPRTWKSALAPYLAEIAVRTGFRRTAIALDQRSALWCRRLLRMVDRCAAAREGWAAAERLAHAPAGYPQARPLPGAIARRLKTLDQPSLLRRARSGHPNVARNSLRATAKLVAGG
jgi:ADP-heptose:LPS heptosyltransferase